MYQDRRIRTLPVKGGGGCLVYQDIDVTYSRAHFFADFATNNCLATDYKSESNHPKKGEAGACMYQEAGVTYPRT